MILNLRRDEITRAGDAVAQVRIKNSALAFRGVRNGGREARVVHLRAVVETADVVLVVQHVQLRLARVRRGRGRQHLPALLVRENGPRSVVVRDPDFLLIQHLRTVDDLVRGVAEVFRILIVGDLVVVDVPGESAAEVLLMLDVERVAVRVRLAIVRQELTRDRARISRRQIPVGCRHLHAAPGHQARCDHQVAVRRDVEVIRNDRFETGRRTEREGRRQEAAAPVARQRKRQPRARDDRHALEEKHAVMRDAFVCAGVEIERRALDVPRRIGLARARRVGAVIDARLLVVEQVDALGAARSARQVEPVLRIRHVAFVRFHAHVRFRADEGIAVADDPDSAVSIGLVGVLVVMQRIRLDHRDIAAQFGRTLRGHVPVGRARGVVAEDECGRLVALAQRPLLKLRSEPQAPGVA